MSNPYLFTGLVACILLLAVVYLWPTPHKHFDELFAPIPPDMREDLERFRKTHPIQYVEVDGLQWPYVVIGQGDTSMVLLHGMAGSWDIWWLLAEALSDRYRLICLSYPPAKGLESYGQGILRVMDATHTPQAHIIGTSMGGYLAQYLLAHQPERVQKVVLGNTFPPNELFAQQHATRVKLLPLLPEWLIMYTMAQHTEKVIVPTSPQPDLVRAFLLEQYYGRMSKAQLISRAKAIMTPFELPSHSAHPILIIESDNDPLVPPALRQQLRQAWPQAQVHTFSQAGHFPYLSQPAQYVQIVQQFLASK